MKVRILGCHGSDHLLSETPPRACRACGLLINERVLLDGGTVGAVLSLSEQRSLRHALISHLHFDHIQGLPTLAEALFDSPDRPLQLISIPEVLKGLHAHIFNGEVYPDFTRLPDPGKPVFAARAIEPEKELRVDGLLVTAVPVNHAVPAVGFVIDDGESAIVYSGDTHQTEQIWRMAARTPRLKAAFIEVSLPDAMADLARVSAHLTPSLFLQEFRKIGRPDLRAYAYHLKPRYRQTIVDELGRLGLSNLTVLEEGQVIDI